MSDAKAAQKLAEASDLQPLLDLASATYDDRMSAQQRNAVQPLLQRWSAGCERPRRPRLWLLLGGWVSASAFALVVLQQRLEPTATIPLPQAITFEVQGGAVEQGGYLRAIGSDDVTAVFSEGTRVTFAAGARGRVLGTTPAGGRLSLEQGRADVRVHPRTAAAWVVHAGPYAVEVTGTDFFVDWSPAQEQLELRLRKGRVTVRGPFAETGIAMTAGQILTIALPAGRVTLNLDSPGPREPASTSTATSSMRRVRERPNRPHPHTMGNATPSTGPDLPPSWSDQVAAGNFDAVVRQAEQQGIQRVLQEGSLLQITALADAARYARRSQLAKAALEAQRHRFPQSSQSREAVFFLARLAEDESRLRDAQPLYDEYLNAGAVGLYAGEALGRKMLIEQRRGGQAAALELAKKYLAKYPNGSYATPARKLVGF